MNYIDRLYSEINYDDQLDNHEDELHYDVETNLYYDNYGDIYQDFYYDELGNIYSEDELYFDDTYGFLSNMGDSVKRGVANVKKKASIFGEGADIRANEGATNMQLKRAYVKAKQMGKDVSKRDYAFAKAGMKAADLAKTKVGSVVAGGIKGINSGISSLKAKISNNPRSLYGVVKAKTSRKDVAPSPAKRYPNKEELSRRFDRNPKMAKMKLPQGINKFNKGNY